MKFYKDINTDEVIYGKDLGDGFIELKANSENGAFEKHVPEYAISVNNKLVVRVGEIDHPMTEEHYIKWIAIVSGDDIVRKYLYPYDEPLAVFDMIDGDITIYAYCNLHGLWMKKVNK